MFEGIDAYTYKQQYFWTFLSFFLCHLSTTFNVLWCFIVQRILKMSDLVRFNLRFEDIVDFLILIEEKSFLCSSNAYRRLRWTCWVEHNASGSLKYIEVVILAWRTRGRWLQIKKSLKTYKGRVVGKVHMISKVGRCLPH